MAKTANTPSATDSGDAKVSKKSKPKTGVKRKTTAWIQYLAENRGRIREQGAQLKEVMQIAAQEWKQLKDKSKWEKLAAAENA